MTKFTPVVLTLLTLSLVACQPDTAKPPPVRTVLVQEAVAANFAVDTVYSGEIKARYESDLAFRVGGKLTARLVDVGSEIRAGQPLARLDPTDLQLAANAARAQLSSAESDYSTASAERERYAGLLAQKFVSQAAFDARENAQKAARGRLEQARAQAEINGNQAAYGVLSNDHPAVVSAVLAEAGQVVAAGQAVLRVARPEQKEIAVAVPEGRLAEFRAAKSFYVSLWANPKLTMRGELRELAPVADPVTRSYAARIRLIEPPPEVRLGMTARLSLDHADNEQTLVPLSAVIDLGQGPLVRTVADGKVVSRPVSVAQFGEGGAVLSSGLKPGEAVIVAGATRLSDGEAVTPRLATPPAQQR